ncbi:MAG: ATP-binding cassette domain-containing protein [Bifidobacteriaceae bacterium]|nr:ATP-binding cassette domain-containing protein [Bifidobacteriaceae bacterium]
MIEVSHLTKRFGSLAAVEDLSFRVEPGRVTGFLGPNGAGKTTTLRLALALIRPTAGTVTFDGRPYAAIPKPAKQIGAALEAASFHPGRTALGHLRMLAPEVGVSDKRCREVLELVGLSQDAKRRVGQFSMGMRGRLGVAVALLGDPGVLLLDEPTNGLDPEGISWMRSLLRAMAGQGRTILISSHLLGEVENTVHDVVIIAKGRMVHHSSLAELRALAQPKTLVAAADPAALTALVRSRGWQATPLGVPDGADPAHPPPGWVVAGPPAQEIGHAAFAANLELTQLASQRAGLEQVFFQLTQGGGLK